MKASALRKKAHFRFSDVAAAAQRSKELNPKDCALHSHGSHIIVLLNSGGLAKIGGKHADIKITVAVKGLQKWAPAVVQFRGEIVSVWRLPSPEDGVGIGDPALCAAIHDYVERGEGEEAELIDDALESLRALPDADRLSARISFSIGSILALATPSHIFQRSVKKTSELVIVRGVLGKRMEVKGAERALLRLTGQVKKITNEFGESSFHTVYKRTARRQDIHIVFPTSVAQEEWVDDITDAVEAQRRLHEMESMGIDDKPNYMDFITVMKQKLAGPEKTKFDGGRRMAAACGRAASGAVPFEQRAPYSACTYSLLPVSAAACASCRLRAAVAPRLASG